MNLVINTPGSYISKRGECFLVKNQKEEIEVSVKKVEQIMISTHISLTTDAIELATENNIDILFLKYNGTPFGRVWHNKLGSINTIRRKQLLLESHPFGMKLVKEWLGIKIDNQIKLLTKLAMNRRDSRREMINETIIKMRSCRDSIINLPLDKNVDEVRMSIQGFEGNAGKLYFTTLGKLLPEKYQFEKRSRNPAEDPFNCLINYAYGVLYSNVEKACMLSGLDPYIGIMHTDNYNKKSLVYDLVEMYRTMMDEMVFKLISSKKINDNYFDINDNNSYFLNQEGKKVLIQTYNELIEKRIRHDNRNIQLKNIIQYDLHKIANIILREESLC